MKYFKICLLIGTLFSLLILQVKTSASTFRSSQIRKANKYIQKNKLEKAESIYEKLPNNKKISFNKGYLYNKKNDIDKSNQYYNMAIKDSSISKREKAIVYHNLGNTYFRQKDFNQAIQYYRKGLLLDPKNKKLKYNLELANNIKQAPNKNKNKDQQKKEQDRKKEKQSKKQKKSAKRKQAEKMLDAFKQKELEDLKKGMAKKNRQKNVEKDW